MKIQRPQVFGTLSHTISSCELCNIHSKHKFHHCLFSLRFISFSLFLSLSLSFFLPAILLHPSHASSHLHVILSKLPVIEFCFSPGIIASPHLNDTHITIHIIPLYQSVIHMSFLGAWETLSWINRSVNLFPPDSHCPLQNQSWQ